MDHHFGSMKWKESKHQIMGNADATECTKSCEIRIAISDKELQK